MFRRLIVLFFLLYVSTAGALELKPLYSFSGNTIYSTTLFPSLGKKFELFKVPASKTKYRVPSAKVIFLFEQQGINLESPGMRSVIFIKKSPVDLSPLTTAVRSLYEEKFPTITIKKILVTPRIYTESLPLEYSVDFGSNSSEHSNGTFYIRTPDNKKLFFDYTIDAVIDVVHTKSDLKRKTELSTFNTTIKNISIDSVDGEPLTTVEPHQYRLKYNIDADTPLEMRDVESSPMVKRGKQVLVSMKNGLVLVEFAATALEDGALHDIIAIRKADGQRVKARVAGLNKVEIE